MVGTIICEVGTIIWYIGTINVRFYCLQKSKDGLATKQIMLTI